MDFPNEILRIIGHYAVSAVVDAQLLDRAGIIKAHSTSLSYVQLEFQDADRAMRAMDSTLFASVRMLKLMQTSSTDFLERLVDLAPNLEELDLGQCGGLTNTIHISFFRKLRSLTMTNCAHFYGFFSDTLRKLTLVECTVDCGTTTMDYGPLVSLELKGCAIARLPSLYSTLEHLKFHGNWFGPQFVDWSDEMTLENWPNLKTLDLMSIDSLDNTRVAPIGRMKNLESLALSKCLRITDYSFLEGLDMLKALRIEGRFDWTMLKHVQLHSFAVRDFDIQDLHHLESQAELRSLRLDQARISALDPVAVLSNMVSKWPNLHTLDFFYCPTLMTTHGFPVCPAVTCLKLDFCKFITNDKLQMMMVSFPNLETFSAAFTGITDIGVAHIPYGVKDLELRGCYITEDALPFLMHLRSLTSLDIAHTKIQQVTMLPKSLQTLDVSGCIQSCVDSARRLTRKRRVKITNTFSIY